MKTTGISPKTLNIDINPGQNVIQNLKKVNSFPAKYLHAEEIERVFIIIIIIVVFSII